MGNENPRRRGEVHNHGVSWLGTQEAGAYKLNSTAFEMFRP